MRTLFLVLFITTSSLSSSCADDFVDEHSISIGENNVKMPILTLGTGGFNETEAEDAVRTSSSYYINRIKNKRTIVRKRINIVSHFYR